MKGSKCGCVLIHKEMPCHIATADAITNQTTANGRDWLSRASQLQGHPVPCSPLLLLQLLHMHTAVEYFILPPPPGG